MSFSRDINKIISINAKELLEAIREESNKLFEKSEKRISNDGKGSFEIRGRLANRIESEYKSFGLEEVSKTNYSFILGFKEDLPNIARYIAVKFYKKGRKIVESEDLYTKKSWAFTVPVIGQALMAIYARVKNESYVYVPKYLENKSLFKKIIRDGLNGHFDREEIKLEAGRLGLEDESKAKDGKSFVFESKEKKEIVPKKKKVLDLDPDFVKLWNTCNDTPIERALYIDKSKEKKEIVPKKKKVLDLDPDFVKPWNTCSDTPIDKSKKKKEIAPKKKKVLELDPDFVKLWNICSDTPIDGTLVR